MAKRKRERKSDASKATQTSTTGEQLDLLDVIPEDAKKIIAVAKKYRAIQAQRIKALEQEVAEKQNLLALIKQMDLKQVDGKIKFRCDGLTITVTPRDELIKVKDESEGNE